MDMISPALLNGVGVVTVVLVFGFGLIRAISKGDLVTRREVEALVLSLEKRAETAERAAEAANAQVKEFIEMTQLAKHSFQSLNEAADR